MKSIARSIGMLVFLFGLLALASCQKASHDTIKIGFAGVQSGPDGIIGAKMFKGSQIAIEEWNARGGVLGKKLEIVSRDDEGKPEKAVSVAQEMVSQGTAAVIGHFNSGCSIPASRIYAQNNILQISPASTNPQLTGQGLTTVFRNVGRDDQQGSVAARFAREKLKVSRIAILHNKTAYGEGIAREVKKTFESLGGTVVLYAGLSLEELDFRASVASMKEAGAEALFWGGMYGQAGPLFNQMRQAGLEIPFISGDGSFDQPFINAVGSAPQNVYLTFGPDYKNIPEAKPFLEKYRAQFSEEEGPYSLYGYDAANMVLQAIQEAGTMDAKAVAEVMRKKAFQTCVGPQEFDTQGDLKKANFILWTVQKGAFIPLPNS